MATHLVMGDPHCTPKASNDRFLWAGKLAHDLKPNTIICMGDFASMDSLCSYDKGKKQFEEYAIAHESWINTMLKNISEQDSHVLIDLLDSISDIKS